MLEEFKQKTTKHMERFKESNEKMMKYDKLLKIHRLIVHQGKKKYKKKKKIR